MFFKYKLLIYGENPNIKKEVLQDFLASPPKSWICTWRGLLKQVNGYLVKVVVE